VTIFWAMRALGKIAPKRTARGRTTAEREPGLPSGDRAGAGPSRPSRCSSPWCFSRRRRSYRDTRREAGTFFGSGIMLLTRVPRRCRVVDGE